MNTYAAKKAPSTTRKNHEDYFRTIFPTIPKSSTTGMLLFQGYMAGYARANEHKDKVIHDLKNKITELQLQLEIAKHD